MTDIRWPEPFLTFRQMVLRVISPIKLWLAPVSKKFNVRLHSVCHGWMNTRGHAWCLAFDTNMGHRRCHPLWKSCAALCTHNSAA